MAERDECARSAKGIGTEPRDATDCGARKQQTANRKQQTGNSKQQTANSKQQTANSKQQTANSKQQTANSKQQTAKERPMVSLTHARVARIQEKYYGPPSRVKNPGAANARGSEEACSIMLGYVASDIRSEKMKTKTKAAPQRQGPRECRHRRRPRPGGPLPGDPRSRGRHRSRSRRSTTTRSAKAARAWCASCTGPWTSTPPSSRA